MHCCFTLVRACRDWLLICLAECCAEALLVTLRAAKDLDPRHAWAAWVALALGAVGELLMLAGLLFDHWEWWQPGIELGDWGMPAAAVSDGLSPHDPVVHQSGDQQLRHHPTLRILWTLWAEAVLHFGLAVAGHSGADLAGRFAIGRIGALVVVLLGVHAQFQGALAGRAACCIPVGRGGPYAVWTG